MVICTKSENIRHKEKRKKIERVSISDSNLNCLLSKIYNNIELCYKTSN